MCQHMDGLFRQEDIKACQQMLATAQRVSDFIQGSLGNP